MKLDARERPAPVPNAHDLPFFGPSTDDNVRMLKALAPDHQTMVAGCFEGIGQATKDSLAVVMNGRGLAVHDPIIAHHLAAIDVADALVAQAHAQDRHCRRELLN